MPFGVVQADKIQGSINSFSPDSSFFRNRIINGAMMIDQRNAGASVTVTDAYTLDRWEGREDSDGAASFQQVADAPTGFTQSAKITTTTADGSLTGIQRLLFSQFIEGFNTADLAFGTASATTVTLSFWVKSSLTGTFAGALQNSARNRSYVFNYTISSANTWEYKTVTVAGDTTGTWIGATNGVGLRVIFALGAGPTVTGTANSWQASELYASSGAISVIGTLNATWQITGVQLEEGNTATSFGFRPYGTELQLCQRYARLCGAGFVGVATASATNSQASMTFGQTMRASPTVSLVSGASVSFVTGEEVQTASSPGINTVYLQPNGICIRISGFTATGSRGDQRVTQSTTDNWLLVTAEL